MEIPNRLKTLYRHWKHHTAVLGATTVSLPQELVWFISERMRIWEKKQNKVSQPYTADKVLQTYRFCNVYRELDRHTIEIHTQLKYLRDDFPLWLLNIAFHRFICRPSTVRDIGLLSFAEGKNKSVYERLVEHSRPKYGNAYVFPISIIQKSKYPTREAFFCKYLPEIMPEMAALINKFESTTVNEALEKLLPVFGFNFKFHWTEIFIDIAYQFPEKIDLYRDFYVGPGALPTAKMINPNNNASKVVDKCVGAELPKFPYLTYNNKPILLSAENWEGIFCEYRKYVNLKNGHGRKRKYTLLGS